MKHSEIRKRLGWTALIAMLLATLVAASADAQIDSPSIEFGASVEDREDNSIEKDLSWWTRAFQIIKDWFWKEEKPVREIDLIEISTQIVNRTERVPIKTTDSECIWNANISSWIPCDRVIGYEDVVRTHNESIPLQQHLRSANDDVVFSELWCYIDDNDYIVCISTRDCQYAVSQERKYTAGCTRCAPKIIEGKIKMDCRGSNSAIKIAKERVQR